MERSVRLLLTLLVVLSGLAAAPAQAGPRADGVSGIEQVQPRGNDAQAVACAALVERVAVGPPVGSDAIGWALGHQVREAMAVREGDRALE